MAEALYRKYRPQVFEDVVGQEPIERTLKNAISQDKVSHAYLFCGPRGTGKTTTARLLAKALLCETGPTPNPDGTCEDCRLIADGVHPDVYELDAASRTGVENVREEIISRVHFAPTRGRYKVYIIDEVHMLSTAAFNALLKTLEEPPSHVVFVLCTTDPQKVPETIHSRCQRFDFHRISPESMVARLGAICVAEDVAFEGEALDLIAQRADGGLRNALTSLEQIIAFENGKVTLAGAERLLGAIDSNDMAEIVAYIGKRDIANCFRWTAAFMETGADLAQFVRDMGEHVRNLYVMALVGDDVDLEVTETARRELANELVWFGPDRAARLLGVLGDLMVELKTTSNPRLAFEIALTRMVRPDSDLTLESLAERIEALESGYSAVAHVLPGAPFTAHVADGIQSAAGEREPLPAGGFADARAAMPSSAPEVYSQESRDDSRSREERVRASELAHDGGVSQVQMPRSASPGEYEARTEAPAMGLGAQPASVQARQTSATGVAGESGDAVCEGGVPVSTVGSSGVSDSVGQAASLGHASRSSSTGAAGSKAMALSNPAALSRIWQATLADVKKRKQAYGVLFMGTKAVFDEAKAMVHVVFPEESPFAYNAAQKPDVQMALEEALAKAVGESVQFCFEKGSGWGSAPNQFSGLGATAQAASSVAKVVDPEGGRVGMVNERLSQSRSVGEQPLQDRSFNGPSSYESRVQAQSPQDFSPNGHMPPSASPQAMSDLSRNPSEASYDQASYDQVPYDEVPYDQVPYDEYDVSYESYSPAPQFGNRTFARNGEPTQAVTNVQQSDAHAVGEYTQATSREYTAEARSVAQAQSQAGYDVDKVGADGSSAWPVADADTTPSPSEGFTPDGAVQEDPAALQALLQQSFGAGVVFSEDDDEER